MDKIFVSVLLVAIQQVAGTGEVMFAVNCGGDAHTDVNGIHYERDAATVGTASEFGRGSPIRRIAEADQILYQTERYHTNTFAYYVPIEENGDYILILKFSEVYFTSGNQKVFDVFLNDKHLVVSNLDIFNKVGRGVAHDEYIPFSINDGMLHVNGQTSPLSLDGKFSINFAKGISDNPKINAIAVLRGDLNDVPRLREWPDPDVSLEQDAQPPEAATEKTKFKKTSGPKAANPYDEDESWLLPIFIAIGVFIPTVICLCRV